MFKLVRDIVKAPFDLLEKAGKGVKDLLTSTEKMEAQAEIAKAAADKTAAMNSMMTKLIIFVVVLIVIIIIFKLLSKKKKGNGEGVTVNLASGGENSGGNNGSGIKRF